MVVIISCGAKKLKYPAPARALYTGPYFKALLNCGTTIALAEKIFILSAKYGLVRLHDRLEPYDMKIGADGSVDAGIVIRQAKRLGITSEKVVALGSDRYIELIRKVLSSVETPLKGKGGLGQQLAWLKEQTTETNQRRWEQVLSWLNEMTGWATQEMSVHPESASQMESWLWPMKKRYLRGERSGELFELIRSEYAKFSVGDRMTNSV